MPERDWNDLRLILTLARVGSLAGAARRLGVDQTTVARRLGRAEVRAGLAFFHRADGRLVPSEAGALLAQRAEAMETLAETALAEATGTPRRIEGVVRVTSVPLLINRLLAPAAGRFLARHPGLELELIPDARDYALTRREADLALRLARPGAEAAARCRRVGWLAFAAYGAPGAPWIDYVEARAGLAQASWQADQPGARAALRVADVETAIALVASGMGRAALPVGFAPPGMAAGEGRPPARELWLLAHPDTHALPRMQHVAAWIAELCATLPRS